MKFSENEMRWRGVGVGGGGVHFTSFAVFQHL